MQTAANKTHYAGSAETHEVINQPTALENYNAWQADTVLRHWVKAFAGDWAEDQLSDYGARAGGNLLQAGFDANHYKPEFFPHNRFGQRVDYVHFHPAYHELMRTAIEAGLHALPWSEPKPGAHVARAAMEYLHSQADPGTGCPLTMTFAAIPTLKNQPELFKQWAPKIMARKYDERNVPYFEKEGLTIGMAMTEKQGGSDVRANTTKAYPLGIDGNVPTFEIVGHKWFCSAPMCDAFLVLAYTDAGLSCFLLPRWKPDGTKNAMYVQRLKAKLGNVSNASSEVEYRGAFAWLVGEEGRGVRTILEMVAMTRFDCMVGSSAQIAQGVMQAIHHCSGRAAFGKNLLNQPLMQNVLADLAIEAEAALAITMRMGHALDNMADENEAALVRIGTAIGKYWICKRAPQHAYECMESIGAVGLIEDNVAARLYRDAPVNAIWEGSGNIQCLDVLRALSREPEALDVFIAELNKARGKDHRYDQFVSDLYARFEDKATLEVRARVVVEKAALAWQAATLLQYGEQLIADAFIASRLSGEGGQMYGTLPPTVDYAAIIARAKPKI